MLFLAVSAFFVAYEDFVATGYATAGRQNSPSQPSYGTCGSAHAKTLASQPVSNLCSAGEATSVIRSPDRKLWKWTCKGSNDKSTADDINCYASVILNP
ncbi:MAG: hypothetical protein QMD85_05065 [Candidatus Aenigmarchaeota archaeon]|nr:hypothetical protein [Candidatus Aenigmarchaeota archaeon]